MKSKLSFKFKNRFASKIQKAISEGCYKFTILDVNGNITDEWYEKNIVVAQGINKLLNMLVGIDAPVTSWYLGIFEGAYTPIDGDTAATFPGSATECTAYSEGTRPIWTPVSSTAKQLTNTASKATFTFTSSKTINGAFLTSVAAKSATSGTLFSGVLFSSPKNVGLGDQLQVTYQLSMTSA